MRLPVAPLTNEDQCIWSRVTARLYSLFGSPPEGMPHTFAPGYDRWDADMMLYLEEMRELFGPWKPEDYPRCMVHSIMLGAEQSTGEVEFP